MLLNDLRFGLRMLRRDPAFTAVAVVTLTLGIGANTAIFTLFNAILLQSLPVREPTRLVLFGDQVSTGTYTGNVLGGTWRLFSSEAVDFMRQETLPFEGIAAVSSSGDDPVSVRLPGAVRAERAQAHLVSGNYFTMMGVTAAYGRTLTADDDRAAAAPGAVVSYPFWAARLRSDPSAVGAVAILNGTPFTIVGVAPREFFGERVRQPPDFWVALIFQPQIQLRPSQRERPDSYWLNLIGRLAPGATRGQAQAATTAALQRFLTAREGAALTDGRRRGIQESRIELKDGAAGISGLRLRYSEPLRVLLAVVGLVLLLACANVGNLLLSRTAARESELTVRMALGAGRGRLVRQVLIESLILAALGAAGGVLLARWVVSGLLALIVSKSSPVQGALDATVLAFTIGVASLAGILFGLAPALSAGRVDLVTALKSRGRGAIAGGGRGFTRALVANRHFARAARRRQPLRAQLDQSGRPSARLRSRSRPPRAHQSAARRLHTGIGRRFVPQALRSNQRPARASRRHHRAIQPSRRQLELEQRGHRGLRTERQRIRSSGNDPGRARISRGARHDVDPRPRHRPARRCR